MSLIKTYRNFYTATEKIVKFYKPHINISYLKINDNSSQEEILNKMKILTTYCTFPKYSHLISKRK